MKQYCSRPDIKEKRKKYMKKRYLLKKNTKTVNKMDIKSILN